MNDHRPSCSFIVGDFNANWCNWYPIEKNNIAGEALPTNTTTAGFSQLKKSVKTFVSLWFALELL